MEKLNTQSLAKKKTAILKLKVVAVKLQKCLLHAKNQGPRKTSFGSSQEMVQKDVKEGYFALIAADHGQERRFMVPLAYLDRPSFQRLLERAAEEYGFNHDGALMVPCRPSELEWMLANRELDEVCWSSCKTMLESYCVRLCLSWFA